MLAGWLETLQNNVPLAWSITFYLMAGLFLALTIYHRFMLPYPDSDVKREGLTPSKLLEDFFKTFVSFFYYLLILSITIIIESFTRFNPIILFFP